MLRCVVGITWHVSKAVTRSSTGITFLRHTKSVRNFSTALIQPFRVYYRIDIQRVSLIRFEAGTCNLSRQSWMDVDDQKGQVLEATDGEDVSGDRRSMSHDLSGAAAPAVVMSADSTDNGKEDEGAAVSAEGGSPGNYQEEGGGGGEKEDPYSKRGYTSEVFKIELENIPQRIGYKDIKSHLASMNLNPVKIKKPDSAPWMCYINFKCEEERQAALQALNGHVWKKKTLSAKVAAPAPDPLSRRKRKGRQLNEGTAKRMREEEMNKTPQERLNSAVTPLLGTPYAEQLKMKEKTMSDFLRKMAKRILHKDSNPGKWFSEHVKQNDGLLCQLEPIRSSPIQNGYRNKCEFSIAVCRSTNQPVVGFRLGSYEEGEFTVVSADTCAHVPERMKQLAKSFQEYFSESSLPPLDTRTEEGHWRMLSVRCYRNGETMAIVQMHPQQLSPDELAAEKRKLTEYFESGRGSQSAPTSLYFQALGRRVANYSPPYEWLLGEKCVHEDMLGLKFRISPDAFFQVNTSAAEVLYSVIKEKSASDIQKPVIYDICCGTGTIGLFLAKSMPVRKVVGVEMVEQAVEDARVNATLNDVSNCEFVCGKAEDVMPEIQKDVKFWEESVGVVDPPRAGLHFRVVDIIRKSKSINKLIYVSCNPEGASKNITDLCRRKSNSIKGLPFRPISAVPVDLFPHTHHCELVILLERIQRHELDERAAGTSQASQTSTNLATESVELVETKTNETTSTM